MYLNKDCTRHPDRLHATDVEPHLQNRWKMLLPLLRCWRQYCPWNTNIYVRTRPRSAVVACTASCVTSNNRYTSVWSSITRVSLVILESLTSVETVVYPNCSSVLQCVYTPPWVRQQLRAEECSQVISLKHVAIEAVCVPQLQQCVLLCIHDSISMSMSRGITEQCSQVISQKHIVTIQMVVCIPTVILCLDMHTSLHEYVDS